MNLLLLDDAGVSVGGSADADRYPGDCWLVWQGILSVGLGMGEEVSCHLLQGSQQVSQGAPCMSDNLQMRAGHSRRVLLLILA